MIGVNPSPQDFPASPSSDTSKTTTLPKMTTKPTASPVPSFGDQCVSGWLPWLNRDIPVTGDGDFEKMTPQELDTLCPGGQITDIDCIDSDSLDGWASLAEASCTLAEGLQCFNLPFLDAPSCRDYKIRYMCDCGREYISCLTLLQIIAYELKLIMSCSLSALKHLILSATIIFSRY